MRSKARSEASGRAAAAVVGARRAAWSESRRLGSPVVTAVVIVGWGEAVDGL